MTISRYSHSVCTNKVSNFPFSYWSTCVTLVKVELLVQPRRAVLPSHCLSLGNKLKTNSFHISKIQDINKMKVLK